MNGVQIEIDRNVMTDNFQRMQQSADVRRTSAPLRLTGEVSGCGVLTETTTTISGLSMATPMILRSSQYDFHYIVGILPRIIPVEMTMIARTQDS